MFTKNLLVGQRLLYQCTTERRFKLKEEKVLVVFHAEDGKDYFCIYENLQEFLEDDTKGEKYGNYTWSGLKCNLTELKNFLNNL